MTAAKTRLAAELRIVAAQCKPDRAATYEALATRALALLRADGRGDTDIAMSLAHAIKETIHD